MPYFEKFCCYFPLNVGGIFLAITAIIVDIITITVMAGQLNTLNAIIYNRTEDDDNLPFLVWLVRGWLIWTLIIESMVLISAIIMIFGIVYVSKEMVLIRIFRSKLPLFLSVFFPGMPPIIDPLFGLRSDSNWSEVPLRCLPDLGRINSAG